MSSSRRAREISIDAPIVNPFEQFTQPEFDDFVGGLQSKIRDALDPRRGLRNRDGDSELSFGLGYGEFKSRRSVSLADSRFAESPSARSVPRSSVEHERSSKERRFDDDEDDEGVDWDVSDHESNVVRHPAVPAVVVSGAGDEESPFVISDSDGDDAPAPSPVKRPTASQTTVLDEDGDEDTEKDEDEDNEDDEEDIERSDDESDPHPQLAGPINIYDDIDDVAFVQDDDAVNDIDARRASDTVEDSREWLDELEDEDTLHNGGIVSESQHTFDEYFTADAPPDYSGDFHRFQPSEPQIQESRRPQLGSAQSALSLPAETVVNPETSSLAGSQMGAQWPTINFPSYTGSSYLDPELGFPDGATGPTFESTPRVSYPAFPHSPPTIEEVGGNLTSGSEYTQMFAQPSDKGLHASPAEATSVLMLPAEEVVQNQRTLFHSEDASRGSNGLDGIVYPSIEESDEHLYSQPSTPAEKATNPVTPALPRSVRTLTASIPSLISDNSSAMTSVLVTVDSSAQAGVAEAIGETDKSGQDRVVPEEVIQEINRDPFSLPDPHRIPDSTLLRTSEGVAGLVGGFAGLSERAAPESFRNDRADGNTSQSGMDDVDSEPELPPPELLAGTSSGSFAPLTMNMLPAASRVHWSDYGEATVGTPQDELDTLQQGLLKSTPLATPGDMSQENSVRVESSVRADLISTPLETPREELDWLEARLVDPTPGETPSSILQGHIDAPGSSQATMTSGSGTPARGRGDLTRDSTLTEGPFSQNIVGPRLLSLASSATIDGDGYFPSQPMSTREASQAERQVETQATLDYQESVSDISDSRAGTSRPEAGSPRSGDSPFSEAGGQSPLIKSQRYTKGRRVATGVTHAVGERELKALQETLLPSSPRMRRSQSNRSSQPSRKSPTKAKLQAKTSPAAKKEVPRIAALSNRTKSLRSNSTISAQTSPTSPISTAPIAVKESARESSNEAGSLGRLDEEEEDQSDVEEHHPKRKRKRMPRASLPGDDEDYLPDETERSIKKRKMQNHELDGEDSLDVADLPSALELAEEQTIQDAKPRKKTKKKPRDQTPKPVEERSPSHELHEGSEFRPSPELTEEQQHAMNAEIEKDAEMISRLSPAAQAKHRKLIRRRLGIDKRAYKPPRESESSDSDSEVEVSQAAILKDLATVVDIDTLPQADGKVGGDGNERQLEDSAQQGATKPKRVRKSGTTKKNKAKATGKPDQDQSETVELSTAESRQQSRDVEMEEAQGANIKEVGAEGGSKSDGTGSGSLAPTSGRWGGFMSFWRGSSQPRTTAPATGLESPSDQMEVD